MKQIAIIDSIKYENLWRSVISGDFVFKIAENAADFEDKFNFDAVIVNADFAGGRIKDTISEAKSTISLKNKPMAVLINECDGEKLEYLCSCGVDDVLRLPICTTFLANRINLLISAFSEPKNEKSNSFDFDELMSFVEESRASKGAMRVHKNEFASICNFVLRGLERSKKSAQVLMFTLNSFGGGDNGSVMQALSDAVQKCLRRGDMSSICSDNQVLVLLTGADDDGGHLVANRIVSNFYSECDDEAFELQYDIREINVANKDK